VSEALKRCPFAKCGGEGQSERCGKGWRVYCTQCHFCSPNGSTEIEAIAAWNDRTPEPWLPIETAPKDGTKVILRSISYNIQEQEIVRIMDNYWTNSGWRCHDPNYRFTHWQPLPAGPTKEET